MFRVRVVNKHWLMCVGISGSSPVNKLITFGKSHEWTFGHVSKEGDFVVVNSLKELYLLKWDSSATEYKLGHRIILPKAVSHGYSENHRLYWFDRSGDIYSQSFDKLRESINNEATRNEICHDIVLETSNFCSLIDMKTGNLLGHEIVAFSDQYYKIRLIERADYHRMLMTISLRTRYAESLFIYKNSKLLVYYDDGKMQLLDDKEILHSANEDKYYVEHPFVGHLAFYTLPDSHNILVHCIDTDEVHLAELNEETLTLATLTKKSYHGEGIAHSEVALVGGHAYMVKAPQSAVDSDADIVAVSDLLAEKIDLIG